VRQWVYLGHVACAYGPGAGEPLWREVLEQVDGLGDSDILNQYFLALYLKSEAVFLPDENVAGKMSALDPGKLLNGYSAEARAHHPFGLIYQSLGMLFERAALQTATGQELHKNRHCLKALEWYDKATEHMKAGGPLLELLGLAARLRRQRLWLQVAPKSDSRIRQLEKAFHDFRKHLRTHFGAAAWGEEGATGTSPSHFGQLDPGPEASWEQRACAVLDGIRFNYW
jgi:hypothetical protein